MTDTESLKICVRAVDGVGCFDTGVVCRQLALLYSAMAYPAHHHYRHIPHNADRSFQDFAAHFFAGNLPRLLHAFTDVFLVVSLSFQKLHASRPFSTKILECKLHAVFCKKDCPLFWYFQVLVFNLDVVNVYFYQPRTYHRKILRGLIRKLYFIGRRTTQRSEVCIYSPGYWEISCVLFITWNENGKMPDIGKWETEIQLISLIIRRPLPEKGAAV